MLIGQNNGSKNTTINKKDLKTIGLLLSLCFLIIWNVLSKEKFDVDSIEVIKVDSISKNKFCPKAVDLIIQRSKLYNNKVYKRIHFFLMRGADEDPNLGKEINYQKSKYWFNIIFDSSPNPKRDGANNYALVYNYFFLEKINEKEAVIFQYRYNPAKKEFTLIDMKTGQVFTEDLSELSDELFQEYENCCN